MKRKIIISILAVVLCLAAWMPPVWIKAKTEKNGSDHRLYKEGQAVVLFRGTRTKSLGKTGAEKLIKDNGIEISDTCNFVYDTEKKGSSVKIFGKAPDFGTVLTVAMVKSKTMSTEEMIDALERESNVRIAVPNYRTMAAALTEDEYSASQWAIENTGQNNGTENMDLNPEALWKKNPTASGKVVAVLDTGIDYRHEDLKANMWVNPYSKQLPGTYGYDYFNKDRNPMDDNGHGTHCAGIIGAVKDNKTGISGIAQNVKIMALKHMGANGSGDLYDALKCYEYVSRAQDLGVDVAAVSNSYAVELEGHVSATKKKELEKVNEIFAEVMDIVGEKGAVSVVAAGNSGSSLDYTQGCPTGADSKYKLTVAAVDSSGNLAEYSNYGKKSVDLAAPGSNILSTANSDYFLPGIYTSDKRKRLVHDFSDYEERKLTDISWGIPKLYEAGHYNPGFMNMSLDRTKWFDQGSQSLKVDFSGVRAKEKILLEIPYTISDVSETVKISMAMLGSQSIHGQQGTVTVLDKRDDYVTGDAIKETEDAGWLPTVAACGEWRICNMDSEAERLDENQQRKIILCVEFPEDGDYSLNLDQIGISRGDVGKEEFGKYMFMDGTSMAAPYVAGAVALIASKDSELSAEGIIDTVKKSVRPVEELKKKTVIGGILDLSKVRLSTKVKSLRLNKKSLKIAKGTSVKLKASVSPAKKKVTWKSSDKRVASVDKNGRITGKAYGKAVITASCGRKKAVCKVTSGYAIRYKLDGGRNNKKNPKAYYKEEIILKNPSRKGYAFLGWYTDKDYTEKITKIKKRNRHSYRLYAKWDKVDIPKKAYIRWISKRQSPIISITCKETEGAEGYQIKYSLREDFKKKHTKTINTKSKNKKIKGLKKNEAYYVRIRTWRKDSTGKRIYGEYSRTVIIR